MRDKSPLFDNSLKGNASHYRCIKGARRSGYYDRSTVVKFRKFKNFLLLLCQIIKKNIRIMDVTVHIEYMRIMRKIPKVFPLIQRKSVAQSEILPRTVL